MAEIILDSPRQAVAFFERSTGDDLFENDFGLSDDFPSKISIRVEGEGFHATITPSIMKGILDLQDAIDVIYKHRLGVYRLTNDQRRKVELVARVEPGSSLFELDISNWLKELRHMTPKQLIVIGAAAVIGFGGLAGFRSYLSHRQDMAQIAANSETQQQLIEVIGTTTDALARQTRHIMAANPDTVSIDDVEYSMQDLHDIARVPRQRREEVTTVVEGLYLVTDLHFDRSEDDIYIREAEAGTVYTGVALQSSILQAGDAEFLRQSANREPVEMRLVVTSRGGTPTGVVLDRIVRE